jgi:leucyl/phenylalanyl-tRNA---protein transferase
VKVFPDPTEATEDGLLCIGGSLDVPTLLQAYSKGIFPWPQEGYPLLWFSPSQRGVLDFSELHLSRTFCRELKRSNLKFTFNKAFPKVIRACSQIPRSHETGTWILPEMVEAYTAFHKAGHAHSIEAWRDGELVGGLYGVYVAGVFSGESMFYTESNASKLCLYKMILHLRNKGLQWLDTQMVTPLVEKLGGKYISRDEFLDRLKLAQKTSPAVIIRAGETPP